MSAVCNEKCMQFADGISTGVPASHWLSDFSPVLLLVLYTSALDCK